MAALITDSDMEAWGSGEGAGLDGRFAYNTAVMNVNTMVIHNTYVDRTYVNNRTVVNNHMSFNGEGGVNARATATEQTAEHENHFQPTSNQLSHEQTARGGQQPTCFG